MIHGKIVLVDGAVTSIGSINFDPRSFALNAEFGVVALDSEIASQLENAFVADLARSRRFSPDRRLVQRDERVAADRSPEVVSVLSGVPRSKVPLEQMSVRAAALSIGAT